MNIFENLENLNVSEGCFSEIMRIAEKYINELYPETVNKTLDKRIDKSIEADDKESGEFNDILKIKNRDERDQAFKKFQKKSDDRLDKENKKLALYSRYVERHPELK